MPIDPNIYRGIDTQYGLKLADLFNPASIAQRQAAVDEQNMGNQLRQMQVMQGVEQMRRAPVLAQREEQQYQAQQVEAQRVIQERAQKLALMEQLKTADPATQKQLFAQMFPEKAAEQAFKPEAVRDFNQPFMPGGQPNTAYQQWKLKEQQAGKSPSGGKLTFSESQGGFIEQPSAQYPQGRIIPAQGFTPKAARPGALSATAQKELFEADDTVQAARSVKAILSEASKINDKAYSGYLAKPRAYLRSNLPGESTGADATIQLDNMMTGQALESLKLIFGGMPTEGERKILMEMQASADKTPSQRKEIINRAMQAAERRETTNTNKAKALRGGTYFSENPQDQPTDQWSDL